MDLKKEEYKCSYCGKIIGEKDSLWVTADENICENCHLFVIKNKELQKQIKQILGTKKKGDKYVIVDLVMRGPTYNDCDARMQLAFTPDGNLIGDINTAKLIVKKGIKPEIRSEVDNICSIGWSEKKKMYYGWTHGKLRGFSIGSKIEDGDILTDIYPVGTIIKNLEKAKEVAIKFIELVAKYEEKGKNVKKTSLGS
jgi:DNA-directed RNA polymerase subunit RPC12/RpoP